MMQNWVRRTIGLAALSLFLAAGCGMFKKEAPKHHGKGAPPAHAKAHGYRAKHHYYYYPNQGIYFDRDKGVYFWYGDGDWRMGPVLPRGVALKGSPKVRVTLDTNRPYTQHAKIKAKHPPEKKVTHKKAKTKKHKKGHDKKRR